MVNTLNEGGRSAGPTAAIFDHYYHMACDFSYTYFVHCPRKANTVAHELANLAKGPLCNSFLDEPSSELIPLLLSDVTLVTTQ